ncbi:hypothetical protein Mfer_1031 [Methanothermus fervidus DSM 2088]|uniref:Uncharacterized protein n=1 Tax=Methanothermus fervidus (strain ATCC 43054 / DSM 2088 / JCM 10308 / V24 S) TaxID=523846 RepID=E3GW61_METFV|nr:hypothetical protein [Methanothermus fervidus]ADP77826.1 hypothetical protein Mfer_1031 [Methanothermus fervidus DSM 2088]
MEKIKNIMNVVKNGKPFPKFLKTCREIETPLRTMIIYPAGCGGFVSIEYYENLDILVIDPLRQWGKEKIIIYASNDKKASIYCPEDGNIKNMDSLSKEIVKEFFELLEVDGV